MHTFSLAVHVSDLNASCAWRGQASELTIEWFDLDLAPQCNRSKVIEMHLLLLSDVSGMIDEVLEIDNIKTVRKYHTCTILHICSD